MSAAGVDVARCTSGGKEHWTLLVPLLFTLFIPTLSLLTLKQPAILYFP